MTLTQGANDILAAVRRQLDEPPFDVFKIDVEGHTSDRPPPEGSAFPTNWELSAAQAGRVVREFIALGLRPEWLQASGFADTQKLVPDRDLTGNPIEANRRKNERIALRLHP